MIDLESPGKSRAFESPRARPEKHVPGLRQDCVKLGNFSSSSCSGQNRDPIQSIGASLHGMVVVAAIDEHLMYKKVLLAYDGSIEGRRALREGAKLAQLCRAEVFLPAVVEITSVASLEGGLAIPIDEQIANYQAILAEDVERLKALGFSPTARLGMGAAGQEIAEVAEEIGANLVVVGHRPTGPLARWWFGSVGTYLIKHLRCSVLVAQTEISDDQFAQLTMVTEQTQFCGRTK